MGRSKTGRKSVKKLIIVMAVAVFACIFAKGAPSFASTWNSQSAKGTYRIKYYKQSSNGKYYYLASSVTKTASVGMTVSASIKSYSGYQVNASRCIKQGKVSSKTILVLKIYYVKKTSCKPATTCKPVATTCRPATTCTQAPTTCKPAATTCTTTAGTTCSTTATSYQPATTAASGSAVTPLLKTSTFKVEHYKQCPKNSCKYNLALTTTFEGNVGDVVYAGYAYFPGYLVNETYACTKASGVVAADGSLVLRVYYDINDGTKTISSYRVYSYKETGKNTNQYNIADIWINYGIVDTIATGKHNYWNGYVMNNDKLSMNERTGVIRADGTTIIKVYYDKQ